MTRRDWVQARQARLRTAMDEDGLDALVVFGTKNVRYLTGFTGGDAAVLVREDGVLLLTDFRFRLQVGLEAPETEFLEIEESITAALAPLLEELGTVGIESNHLTVDRWQRMSEQLGGADHRLVAGMVEGLRRVKGPEELPAMREAARLAALTEQRLRQMPVVGRSERDVALDLETWVRREGSEEVPFPFIVATGPRGAMPHAEPSSAVVRPGQLLVVDLGATVQGYASDITRTFATGPLDGEQRAIYELVLRPNGRPATPPEPGMTCASWTPWPAASSRMRARATSSSTAWATASAWTSTRSPGSPPGRRGPRVRHGDHHRAGGLRARSGRRADRGHGAGDRRRHRGPHRLDRELATLS